MIKSISQRIKALRKYLNISQKDFGATVGLSPSHISKFELGVFNPSSESLIKINKAHRVNLHWLLTGEGKMLIQYDNKSRPSRQVETDEHVSSAIPKVLLGREIAEYSNSVRRAIYAVELRQRGKTLAEIGKELGCTRERARMIILNFKFGRMRYGKLSNFERRLSNRALNVLRRSGLKTPKMVLKQGPKKLIELPGMGKKSLLQVAKALVAVGAIKDAKVWLSHNLEH